MLKTKKIKWYTFRGIDLLRERDKAGLSQRQLAKACHFLGTQQNIARIESSDSIHYISEKNLAILNRVLGNT